MASPAVHTPSGHATTFEPKTAEHVTSPPAAEPHNVQTVLNYYLDTGKPPEPVYRDRPETFNREPVAVNKTVYDVRGEEANYSLDLQGFQFHKHVSAETEFLDEDRIKEIYYPETEQLLKDVTGASRVFIFDHTIRGKEEGVARGPVTRVHIDQSYSASRSRVPHHLPDESERLLKTRYSIINVWRPIRKILKDPLGVADARTVHESDLVPIGLIYPNRNGETLSVKPNDSHKWYFLYGQDVDEVTLIKCFDSKEDGRARRIPHSAFVDPAHEGDYGRESIEVRALVFHEDQPAN